MLKNKKIIFLLSFTAVFIISFRAQDQETAKDMPFINDSSSCLDCHSRDEINSQYSDPSRPCDSYCKNCHKDMDAHHRTGMEVDFETSTDIRLRDKHLVCTSCHDLKTGRYDSIPWKSQGLFGKIFRGKTKYPTYFLIKNNRGGQLCKDCH